MDDEALVKRAQLRRAVYALRERGLYQSAKWAAEQAVGLLPQARDGQRPSDRHGNTSTSTVAAFPEFEEEDEIFLLAKAYFDLKEYRRCAHALKGQAGSKSVFLRCFALYLAGEKRKGEEAVELAGLTAARGASAGGPPGTGAGAAEAASVGGGAVGGSDAVNQELAPLDDELAAAYSQGALDSFGKYLYGVVLADRDRKDDARAALVESVNEYPWHWGAWQSLQSLCATVNAAEALPIARHWMRDFFLASLCLELQQNVEGVEHYQALQVAFPRSDYVMTQAATAHYNMRDFDEAQTIFQQVLERDPHRIEGMDMYSNILYVKECFVELSFLAHRASLTDKYRPETCCIIGNYYSLKGQHEKAVLYFNRALKLNRNYLSAWTLMGHEYVEMKNPAAAIDAYRRAVDINPRDYRAWYGLGQTYELLQMPYYALYYYRRATQLRPQDARMWCAMGQCYEHEQLAMDEAAIQCYGRALDNDDREGIALHKLARLNAKLGHKMAAAELYERNLERLEEEDASDGADAVEALLYLGSHYKELGDFDEAELFCTRLLNLAGPAKEDAKALLREISAVQRAAAQSPGMSMSPGSPLQDSFETP